MLLGLKDLTLQHAETLSWVGCHPPDDLMQREVERQKPHVVVIDDHTLRLLPDAPAWWAQKRIGVVLVSQTDDLHVMEQALGLGVPCIVHEAEPLGTMLGAIAAATRKRIWLPPQLRDHVLAHHVTLPERSTTLLALPGLASKNTLSEKEKILIDLVVRHPEAKSLILADWMGVRESTIRNRLSRIYSKLHLRGRAALVKFVHEGRSTL